MRLMEPLLQQKHDLHPTATQIRGFDKVLQFQQQPEEFACAHATAAVSQVLLGVPFRLGECDTLSQPAFFRGRGHNSLRAHPIFQSPPVQSPPPCHPLPVHPNSSPITPSLSSSHSRILKLTPWAPRLRRSRRPPPKPRCRWATKRKNHGNPSGCGWKVKVLALGSICPGVMLVLFVGAAAK